MERMSQATTILKELEKGRTLSFFDIVALGITNHTGRIADLRHDLFVEGKGRTIKTEMQEKNGKKFAIYSLSKIEQLNLV